MDLVEQKAKNKKWYASRELHVKSILKSCWHRQTYIYTFRFNLKYLELLQIRGVRAARSFRVTSFLARPGRDIFGRVSLGSTSGGFSKCRFGPGWARAGFYMNFQPGPKKILLIIVKYGTAYVG